MSCLILLSVSLLMGCQNLNNQDASAFDVTKAKSVLTITYAPNDSPSNVTQNITLPTAGVNGVIIAWSSSSLSVISDAGVVTRPTAGQFDAQVSLTATLTKNNAIDTKIFPVVVKGVASLNVAKGKSVEADSEQANHPAIYGNDGDDQTRWSARDGNHGHWYIINLQRPYHVKLSKFIWEFSGEYQYDILASNDKLNWVIIIDRSTNSEWSTLTTDPIDATYQYFKIVIHHALKHKPQPENTWDSFYEWELY